MPPWINLVKKEKAKRETPLNKYTVVYIWAPDL